MAKGRLDTLIDDWEPKLQRAFLDAVYAMRDAAHIEQIARMLENGDVDGAIRAVGLDPVQFRSFDKSIADAFEAGGNTTAKAIPVAVDAAGFRTIFQFNVRNPDAERWLSDYSSNLVTEILDDQRTAIRNNLSAGLRAGNNPRTTALDLVGRIGANGKREGGIIGLTSSQEEWVRAYAADLASDDPAQALTRELRDKRFDGAVLRAAKDEKPLSNDQINTMVRAYSNRALRYRAETIARAETITALHEAQDKALDQAVDAGVISANALTLTWRSAHDGRVREAHAVLDGQSIKKGGVFHSILGPIRFPGDPQASAANTVNCRCYLQPSVDFLAGAS